MDFGQVSSRGVWQNAKTFSDHGIAHTVSPKLMVQMSVHLKCTILRKMELQFTSLELSTAQSIFQQAFTGMVAKVKDPEGHPSGLNNFWLGNKLTR